MSATSDSATSDPVTQGLGHLLHDPTAPATNAGEGIPPAWRAEAAELAGRYLHRLTPARDRVPVECGQSLIDGAAGIALGHGEHARHSGSWATTHAWIRRAVADPVSAADTTGLYLGVPALAFALHSTGHYRGALAELDRHVVALTHRRLDTACARIAHGDDPGFREYDLFFGLTGLGAHLLRRDPGASVIGRVLDYLVALTRPHGDGRPGWWVGHDPHRRHSPAYPGGHANLGLAHGIAGPLALLALAHRRGAVVDGHLDALTRINDWLDRWRQDSDTGSWWPQWITRADHQRGRPTQPHPGRPSWCYGTPGIARAGQLAALALHDPHRRRDHEHVLADCLDDPVQYARVTGPGLCHGIAGLYQTLWRAARDASTPRLTAHLPRLARALLDHARAHVDTGSPGGPGLLDGDTGIVLALHTLAHDEPPTSGWDSCLLLS